MLFFPVLLGIAVVGAVVLLRRHRHHGQHRNRQDQARVLRRTGFGAMAFSTAFIGLFIVGDTFTDPGGWAAVGLISLWLLPLLVLGTLAWRHPDLGLEVLGALVGVMVVASVWFALDPQGWRDFEDSRGPVRTVATFAIAAAIALVGLRRPGVAGLELVVLAIVPPMISSIGSGGGPASLIAVASVPLLAGVLYLASALVTRPGAGGYGRAG